MAASKSKKESAAENSVMVGKGLDGCEVRDVCDGTVESEKKEGL